MPMLSDLADRPALDDREIEITPEMIRAAADVLRDNSMIFEVLSPSFAEILSEQILCSALSVKTQVRIA
jgi:hypothetical protein